MQRGCFKHFEVARNLLGNLRSLGSLGSLGRGVSAKFPNFLKLTKKHPVMPQLGKVLIGRYASAYIAQLNGIYLWEYYLTSTNLTARAKQR